MTDVPNTRHGGGHVDPPVEALLTDDPELWLAWAPLTDDHGSCRHGACESDDVCTCQDEDVRE